MTHEQDDQAFIDALSSDEWMEEIADTQPAQMDEDQLLCVLHHTLKRLVTEMPSGKTSVSFADVGRALECVVQLKRIQLPDPGPDYMREEYDFALAEPIDPAVVAAARAQFDDPPPPPIRKLPDAEPRVEQGPVQFGEQWPGLYLNGKSCILYEPAVARAAAAAVLANDYIGHRALLGLMIDLRAPLLKPGDPRR